MILKKLFTDEDPFNIHKIMGFYCLLNFGIQTTMYFFTREMYITPTVLIPHFLLNATSFIFSVLKKRPVADDGRISKKMSMFIWEELRVHSLIFSYRSLLSILYPEYGPYLVFLTLFLADVATNHLGTKGVSTVRGNQNFQSTSLIKQIYSGFFSISQIGATLICGGFFQDIPSSYLMFVTLPAIQTSAFGMTLLRKNLISKETWQIVYSSELTLVYLIWLLEYKNLNVLWISILLYMLRKNGMNKYILWIGVWMFSGLYSILTIENLRNFFEPGRMIE